MQMAETHLHDTFSQTTVIFSEEYKEALKRFELNKAVDYVWGCIQTLDRKISETEPFKLIKTNPKEGTDLILSLVLELYRISFLLEPIMPETSKKIRDAVETHKKPENLFLRKDS